MINIDETVSPTILIVDDMKSNLILLSELLDDYDIVVANSGSEAIEIANNRYLDLILLDIVMPEMDGYEVCLKLKEEEKTKDIPIIFVTGNTDEDSIDRAYKVGGVDYVTKPFMSKELLARIKTQVSLSNITKELNDKIALIDKYVSYSYADPDGVITDVSEAFCEVSGYSKEELIGQNHNILRHPEMPKEVYGELWKTITKGKKWVGEIRNLSKDGSSFWADVVITPRFDNSGNISGYTAIRHDITYQKRVEILSITDQLTMLFNRRYFNDMLPVEIKRAIRQSACLSFMMLDIDFFKQYNDTYGHQAGDDVLEKVGKALNEQAKRAEDLMFRLGGEEFGVIFTSTSPEDAEKIAQGVKNSILNLEIEHKMSKVHDNITVSIGLACIDFSKKPNHNLNEGNIYKLADDELYKSKNQGRNRISSMIL